MTTKQKGNGGLTGSTRSLNSYPQICGGVESNFTPPLASCQSSRVVSPKDAYVMDVGKLRGVRFPALDALEVPYLSNVAKVHEGERVFPLLPALPPVVGVQIYPNDIRLVRAAAPARGGGPRAKCSQISASAIKNGKFVIANSAPELFSLIACTYPATYPVDGRIVKAHHKALLQRIRRRFGSFSYFTAFEYQKAPRCAPHFHIAISLDIRSMGEVVKLQRKGQFGRRRPSFLTVQEVNNWLFESWLDIISSSEEITYKKEVLDWSGLPSEDIAKMRVAFYECNSAVAWEVMRSDTGAKHYMVKELSGLKGYQKLVPEWYDNPGRHFLYSRDMRPGDPLQCYQAGDMEVREILESLRWRWMPENGRPLNKTIWNLAASVVVALLDRGYDPVDPVRLERLRRFDDVRMVEFVGGSVDYSEATKASWFDYQVAVEFHNHKKRIKAAGGKGNYEFIISQGGY